MGLITKACRDREIISIYKLVKYILNKNKDLWGAFWRWCRNALFAWQGLVKFLLNTDFPLNSRDKYMKDSLF